MQSKSCLWRVWGLQGEEPAWSSFRNSSRAQSEAPATGARDTNPVHRLDQGHLCVVKRDEARRERGQALETNWAAWSKESLRNQVLTTLLIGAGRSAAGQQSVGQSSGWGNGFWFFFLLFSSSGGLCSSPSTLEVVQPPPPCQLPCSRAWRMLTEQTELGAEAARQTGLVLPAQLQQEEPGTRGAPGSSPRPSTF